MSRLIFIGIFLFLKIAANSQIEKGYWMIGGAASLRSSHYDLGNGSSSRQSIVQLSGDVGHFFFDKFAAGLKPGYNRTATNSPHNVVNTFNIGPFVRYYLLSKEKYVNIFSELCYQYGITKNSQTSASTTGNSFTGAIGCAAFFNSSVALEFTLAYSAFSYNNTGNVKSVIAGIGFHFHLEKED